jgi:hypothetical protein
MGNILWHANDDRAKNFSAGLIPSNNYGEFVASGDILCDDK